MSTTTTTSTDTTNGPIAGARTGVICVDSPTGGAGALLWWTLSGSIEYARLRSAWRSSGLPEDDCPEEPSAQLAFRIAIQAQAHGRRFARRFEGGWTIAEERRDESGGWSAVPLISVRLDESRLDEEGHPSLDFGGGEIDAGLAALVRAHYLAALVDWPTTSVSTWLPRYVRARCDGVSMRDSGGIYYVPPAAVDRIQQIRLVLEGVSLHRIVLVQALRTADAVAAILAALCTDTDAAIEAALQEASTPLRARHRVAEVQELRSRLLRYEELLGARHADLGERIDEAERSLALLALSSAAE
jgi:hypothetical protein